jgi:hypothetical protein
MIGRQPKRDWRDSVAKCEAEGRCRSCGVMRGLQQAHTIGRTYDQPKPGQKTLWVDPDAVIPLCHHCHVEQESGDLSILGLLSLEEQLYAVKRLGSIEAARRKLDPLDYRRDIEAARVEARLAA